MHTALCTRSFFQIHAVVVLALSLLSHHRIFFSPHSTLYLHATLHTLLTTVHQELTEFPIMAVGAEKEIQRYIPPRTGTLTLVVVDGFTLKVSMCSVGYVYVLCAECII